MSSTEEEVMTTYKGRIIGVRQWEQTGLEHVSGNVYRPVYTLVLEGDKGEQMTVVTYNPTVIPQEGAYFIYEDGVEAVLKILGRLGELEEQRRELLDDLQALIGEGVVLD